MDTTETKSTEESVKNQPTNPQTPTPEPKPKPLHELPPRLYDVAEVSKFLDGVFHVELWHDEEILTWKAKPTRPPGYPVTEPELIEILKKTRVPGALYFGLSTCKRTPEGDLRNRKNLFCRLFAVVLDDIGTKVPIGNLPPDLDPSWIIESSEGNFQYGFILEQPLDDLTQAEMLVQLVFDSGLTDAGGKMPTKLVRLPQGVNGKKGVKCGFVTRLVEFHPDRRWTPQDLLDVLDISVEWSDVEKDAEAIRRQRAHKSLGTSSWADVTPVAQTLDGLVDPVAEWLYESGLVTQDTGDWITFRCPWHTEHTTGDLCAGYSPLGCGEEPESRWFNCFHDHCKGKKTTDFLKWVAEQSGIEVGAVDPGARLVASFVFDASSDGVWEVKGVDRPKPYTISAFRNWHSDTLTIHLRNGRTKRIKEHEAWAGSKSRVVVRGTVFEPSDPARIVVKDGHKYINTFAPPDWGAPIIEQAHVDKFTEYLTYLIPDAEERNYFLDWLAAKAQDMGFRGPAILMVADQQGTGRSTLMDMLGVLFSPDNLVNIPFDKMIGEAQFNEWMESPLVVSDETLNTGDRSVFRAYERLKEIVDTRPKLTRINPKYGKTRRTMVHSSFILLSNHADALVLVENDRRIYVLRNAKQPNTPEYFTELNRWLRVKDSAGRAAWARSVWYWLREREFDIEQLLSPPAMTVGKESMIEQSRSPLEVLAEAFRDAWPDHGLFSMKLINSLTPFFGSRVELENGKRNRFVRCLNKLSEGYPTQADMIVKTPTSTRPRLFNGKTPPDALVPGPDFAPTTARALAKELLTTLDLEAVKKGVSEYLDLHDL